MSTTPPPDATPERLIAQLAFDVHSIQSKLFKLEKCPTLEEVQTMTGTLSNVAYYCLESATWLAKWHATKKKGKL